MPISGGTVYLAGRRDAFVCHHRTAPGGDHVHITARTDYALRAMLTLAAAEPSAITGWQDTGSGVFAIAVAALLLGIGPLASGSGRQLAGAALLAGLGAFLVDVYLY
jgi:hypothetical protein